MQVTIRVQRYNPKTDKEPYMQEYQVDLEPDDRVLDALIQIKRNQDGTLGFRRSCAHGVCGSDAMRINGKEGLACKTLVNQVVDGDAGVIELLPLRHLTVQRDLMVDQSKFFQNYREVQPFLLPKEGLETSHVSASIGAGGFTPAKNQPGSAEALKSPKTEDPTPSPGTTAATGQKGQDDASGQGEYLQSPAERALFDEATKCILCAACYSACPVLDKNPNFIGPAAIVQAARFVNDSRDMGLEPRLKVLDQPDGVWPCENHFECTRVCPRDIKITKLINLTKRQIKGLREERGESIHE
jgi:succinate dehydrogenase / fumarate reductase iron-sulfur subunit